MEKTKRLKIETNNDKKLLIFLECEYKFNLILKVNSRGKYYFSFIYYNLILSLIDMKLKFF